MSLALTFPRLTALFICNLRDCLIIDYRRHRHHTAELPGVTRRQRAWLDVARADQNTLMEQVPASGLGDTGISGCCGWGSPADSPGACKVLWRKMRARGERGLMGRVCVTSTAPVSMKLYLDGRCVSGKDIGKYQLAESGMMVVFNIKGQRRLLKPFAVKTNYRWW